MNVVFCGNPGSGKSTLCNCVFQKPVFKSGISSVVGMTTESKIGHFQGVNYIDTPGLADPIKRVEAGKQITAALKMGGQYKIIFVTGNNSGRLNESELATMLAICDAIRTDFEYGIVITKVTSGARNAIVTDIMRFVEVLPKRPSKFLLIDMVSDAHDVNDYVLNRNVRMDMLEFVDSLEPCSLGPLNVRDINTQNLEQRLKDAKRSFYTNELAKRRLSLARSMRQLDLAKDGKSRQESTINQKTDQIRAASREMSINNTKLEGLKRDIDKQQKKFYIGAGSVGAGGATIGAGAMGMIGVAAAPVVALPAIGIATMMAMHTRSKNDQRRRDVSSLERLVDVRSNNIYSYGNDVQRASEQLNVYNMSLQEAEDAVEYEQHSIDELEQALRCV